MRTAGKQVGTAGQASQQAHSVHPAAPRTVVLGDRPVSATSGVLLVNTSSLQLDVQPASTTVKLYCKPARPTRQHDSQHTPAAGLTPAVPHTPATQRHPPTQTDWWATAWRWRCRSRGWWRWQR